MEEKTEAQLAIDAILKEKPKLSKRPDMSTKEEVEKRFRYYEDKYEHGWNEINKDLYIYSLEELVRYYQTLETENNRK